MRRIFLTFMLLASVCISVSAQTFLPMTAETSAQAIKTITAKITEQKTLQSEFVQTKHMSILDDVLVSYGNMSYVQPGSLRWQYDKPYVYTFIMNNDKVLMQSSQTKNVIDVKSNKLFQEITKIMMNSMTGQCLTETATFSVAMFESADNLWKASLTPKKKDMKQMFQTIALYFDSRTCLVQKIEMTEQSGDKTTIELTNITINKKIDERLFKVE